MIEKHLATLGLTLNKKKYIKKDLIMDGDHIKYLGLNIVKNGIGNTISVGKTYKNYVAKCYLKYIKMTNDIEKENRYYLGKQIAGYLSFVKMIEGEGGLKKIYKRIEKSTEGRVVIKERIENL